MVLQHIRETLFNFLCDRSYSTLYILYEYTWIGARESARSNFWTGKAVTGEPKK